MKQVVTKHFLYPSNIYTSQKETEVTTILGSCVAVCLWDKRLQIGGINHYMLPLWNGEGLASPKYGNIAIKRLVQKMQGLDSNISDLQAKIFGGASNLHGESYYRIGERNVLIAREKLQEFDIPIIAQSVEGNRGRKIVFNTRTGQVLMRYVSGQNPKT